MVRQQEEEDTAAKEVGAFAAVEHQLDEDKGRTQHMLHIQMQMSMPQSMQKGLIVRQ